jgi:methionyl aminopeptidase
MTASSNGVACVGATSSDGLITMIPIKTKQEMAGMRAACRLAAQVRDQVSAACAPGVRTIELGDLAEKLIRDAGAVSAFYGYRGFPGQICCSLNDEVVHGIPSERLIQMGDIVSLDFGVLLDGFYGDTAKTVMVGVTDQSVISLVRTAERALLAGIAEAAPGAKLSNVSHRIQSVSEKAGFSIVRDFVGHGIGRELHEEPQVPNFGKPNRGPVLREGMTIAIEPMLNMGSLAVEVQDDEWTVVTVDGAPAAHVEHTVAITADGPEILTAAE